MTVLMAHVEDDWTEFPTNETKIFADTPKGTSKAIEYVESMIPWKEGHMQSYFKGCTNQICKESKELLAEMLKLQSVSSMDIPERFSASFQFCISREDVEE